MARIMLVDDDRSLLELLGDYLGRLGHDVSGARRRRDGPVGRSRSSRPSW